MQLIDQTNDTGKDKAKLVVVRNVLTDWSQVHAENTKKPKDNIKTKKMSIVLILILVLLLILIIAEE